jgi:EAL domain-containing protein (putative c-di-GMP-specific phosphodiesterase class I)
MAQYGDRIIVLDDDPLTCDFVKDVAQEAGFAVLVPGGAPELLSSLDSFQPDVIFLDLLMPNTDGIEVIRRLAEAGSEAQLLLASGEDYRVLNTAKSLAEARGLKVADVLEKPIRLHCLESSLRRIRAAGQEITEGALERGIADRQLVMSYQPKLRIDDSGQLRIESLEALVRWQHPDLGVLLPDRFIGLAEKSLLMLDLTDYVIETVLRQQAEWHRAGAAIPVAVNLSARFIDDLDLPDRLAATAKRHGIDPRMVILEITESGAMSDVTRAMDVLSRLRLKGFNLSIDDFGTGYSSMVQLYRMPFSELKIDREFVTGLPDDRESATIVKGIVDLAHALDLQVCVEGVETESALSLLRQYRCDLYQGFYFYPPLQQDDVEALLHARDLSAIATEATSGIH